MTGKVAALGGASAAIAKLHCVRDRQHQANLGLPVYLIPSALVLAVSINNYLFHNFLTFVRNGYFRRFEVTNYITSEVIFYALKK